MFRLLITNDEERVMRMALEEFIAARRIATSHTQAQRVADRTTARELLYNMRCVAVHDA
jgi:hypothetical protein